MEGGGVRSYTRVTHPNGRREVRRAAGWKLEEKLQQDFLSRSLREKLGRAAANDLLNNEKKYIHI